MEDMKPKEEVLKYPVSRKSSSQPLPIQQPGGLVQQDSISIPINCFEDSPNAITWDLQEQPQMEILNTPYLLNLTQPSLEQEMMKTSLEDMSNIHQI